MNLDSEAPKRLKGRAGAWLEAGIAVALAAVILMVATAAGLATNALFDAYGPAAQPRAYAAGVAETLTTLRLALFLFAFQAMVIALTMLAVKHSADGAGLLPFSRPKGGVALLFAAAAGLLVVAALFALFVYTFDRGAFINDIGIFSVLMRSQGWWLMLVAAGFGAPLAEEMLFRGYLFGKLRRSPLGLWGAVVASAGMWAALHPAYSVYGLLAILLIGIYLALLRERTASLVAPIVCHAGYNSLIVLALAFAPDGALGL